MSGNRHWPRVWRDPQPKLSYDVVIVTARPRHWEDYQFRKPEHAPPYYPTRAI